MTDTIEIYIDHAGETHRVGLCRYVGKRRSNRERRGQSSVFEYADEWLEPANTRFEYISIYGVDRRKLTID